MNTDVWTEVSGNNGNSFTNTDIGQTSWDFSATAWVDDDGDNVETTLWDTE